jgi:hypothetical protein
MVRITTPEPTVEVNDQEIALSASDLCASKPGVVLALDPVCRRCDIIVHSGDSMALEILEFYPGEKSTAVAISELVVQGAH